MFTNEQLLSADFDADAYLRYALHSSSLSSEQERLDSCLAEVRSGMQTILGEHSDSMVSQLQASHAAQRDAGAARQSVDSLARATDRLRLMIEEPYNSIQDKLTELENANKVVGVLQDVHKFLSLSSRLQEMVMGGEAKSRGGELDPTRPARSLKEIEDLCATAPIRGVEVVESRMPVVEKASAVVRNRVHELLSVRDLLATGGATAATLNKTVLNTGIALSCAYTLGTLGKVVHGFMMERKREVLKTVMRDLDVQSIAEQAAAAAAAGKGAPSSSAPLFSGGVAREELQYTQEALLSRVQGALFAVVQQTQCAVLLWRIVLRKLDPLTQASLFRALESPVQLLVDYWNTVMEKLRERLLALQKRTEFEAALTAGYPAFRKLLESFLSSSGDLASAAAAPDGVNAAGAAADMAAGPSLLVLNVQQWGLGDYLDLIQVVETASLSKTASAKRRNDGAAVSSSSSATDTLRRTWLSAVTNDLQSRFSALLMDRHREKVGAVLSRLASMTPPTAAAGAQQVPSGIGADSRRGGARAQSNALELSQYTRLALQDCYLYRQDPLALSLAIRCVLSSTQQLLSKLRESVSRHPLPPLPAVTANVTRTQLMHACIANGCTTLVLDLTNILALLPDAAAGAADAPRRVGDEGADDGDAATAGSLAHCQRQLRETTDAFRALSEASALPFLHSARVVLLSAVSYCVEVASSIRAGSAAAGGAADNRAFLQLRTRIDVVLDNFYCLIDPQTSGWLTTTRRLADALIARLLAQCATAATLAGSSGAAGQPPTRLNLSAFHRSMATCVQETLLLILSFASATQGAGPTAGGEAGAGGGVGRSTLMLKGSARQAELQYRTLSSAGTAAVVSSAATDARLGHELAAILRPLHPMLAKLYLLQALRLQRGQEASPPPDVAPPAALASADKVTAALEQGLLCACEPALKADEDGAASDNARASQDDTLAAMGEAADAYWHALGDGAGTVFNAVWHNLS